jgi:isocitrate dehydrogenase
MKGKKTPITVAEGDGIGPEIMAATLHILEESGANLDIHHVEIGEKVYLRGSPTGIEPKTWDTIRQSKAFLKAPISTPQGGGFKSLNVTIRTAFGLYANVRPCVSYHPFVETKHPKMDVVIIRENEEDLYTGIEYRQTQQTFHALKVITRPGCEKIIRYAFEYAIANNRKKVTCFTKDNILKLSDGLFHKVFDEIASEYPIQNEHWIVDIGAAKLADTPEAFDVIVMPNLYGDILSDVAAQIAGSVGLAGSANIGEHHAMFEAIHGSAPRRAGQNLANPSGLLLASVLMLVHIGQPEAAANIHNAWLKTLESGIHTYDIFKPKTSKEKVGTQEFAQAVVNNLGKDPETFKPVHYSSPKHLINSPTVNTKLSDSKETVGVDIFIHSNQNVDDLQKGLKQLKNKDFELTMISNRGVSVWPQKMPEVSYGDAWRCRFMCAQKGGSVTHQQIAKLIQHLADANIDFVHTEHLCTFNGRPGYTLAQEEQ